MTVYVGDARISRRNTFGRRSLVTLDDAWRQLKPALLADMQPKAKALLWEWRGDQVTRRYADFNELAAALQQPTRRNYYYQREGENYNLAEVVYAPQVDTASVGWSEHEFFERLGHEDKQEREVMTAWQHISSFNLAFLYHFSSDIRLWDITLAQAERELQRRAEQEYLLQSMVKGALVDAATLADRYGLGIAVRPTGLLAHMGIESGDPTKAQEFKNKTSKEVDLWLCDELRWQDLGAVVHYDPRVEWSSQKAANHARSSNRPLIDRASSPQDWQKKWQHIEHRRKPALKSLGPRINQHPDPATLKKQFENRVREYLAEDYAYRQGHFALYTFLDGPRVRLGLRPQVNMVGDHDLFAFTLGNQYGVFAPATHGNVAPLQRALQLSQRFQAQHGGIWYWQPQEPFHQGIKQKIMGGHSPDGDEPLVYILPGNRVHAAYYVSAEDRLYSVWHDPSWTKWLKTTHSGKLLLTPPTLPGED